MVLVSHKHKFIFLKTRKTAGSSIELYLQKYCGPPSYTPNEITDCVQTKHGIIGFMSPFGALETRKERARRARKPGNEIWRSHMKAGKVKENLPGEQWETYRKLSAVRNPFDRTVSLYYFRNNLQGRAIPDDFADVVDDFTRFVT